MSRPLRNSCFISKQQGYFPCREGKINGIMDAIIKTALSFYSKLVRLGKADSERSGSD